jgi:hypothetical protein
MHRAGIIVAALVLPCCGGVTLLGALADEPGQAQQVSPASERQPAVPDPTTEEAEPPAVTETGAPRAESTTPPATVPAAPVVRKRTVTERKAVAFKTRTVRDGSLDKGDTRVRTKGVRGVRTLTYEVTVTDGKQTARRLLKSEVTRKPVTKVVAVGTRTSSGGDCQSGYSPCVPVASDVDCAGGGGNGPAYVSGPVWVTGSDPYDLDRDGDGIACDT